MVELKQISKLRNASHYFDINPYYSRQNMKTEGQDVSQILTNYFR